MFVVLAGMRLLANLGPCRGGGGVMQCVRWGGGAAVEECTHQAMPAHAAELLLTSPVPGTCNASSNINCMCVCDALCNVCSVPCRSIQYQ